MSYKSDFEDDDGWSAVDTNIKLNTQPGKIFRQFLKERSVSTIIRYYASSVRSKTTSRDEAQLLSSDGFYILPVFQDTNREPEHFGAANGKTNAISAKNFANRVGQPEGTTILFAADADFTEGQVADYIVPYFEAVQEALGGTYRIGAYGSGLVLSALLKRDLIEVPWISMSRSFRGTQDFFYSDKWAMRQVPPDRSHGPSGTGYDVNILKKSPVELGAFSLHADGARGLAQAEVEEAILGGRNVTEIETLPRDDGSVTASRAYVTTEGLNLRETPNGEIISELTIAQVVVDLGPAQLPGWRRVKVDGKTGCVFGKYLRTPAAPEIEAMIASAVGEWLRFDKGRADEKSDPYYRYVGEMWASIGQTWDGRSKYPDGSDVPWSAAFISFVVRRSGASYRKFLFDASHSVFSHDAIQARILNRMDKPFWGYRITEAKPSIGDIIHRNRGGSGFTFDCAENHSQFPSHSDFVVEVTDHIARVLGGNVGDTVSMRSMSSGDDLQEYQLDANGFIAPGQKVIAVLKNRASEI